MHKVLFLLSVSALAAPNVLFIAIDDLNHWVTHLGRNAQAKTPNIDRLAKMGVSFRHAYCAVPACEPSRHALMSGRRPWTSGCYSNGDGWKRFQKPGEGLAAQFKKAGYHVAGAGKIYHSMDFLEAEWTEYMSRTGKGSGNGPGVDKMDGYFGPQSHDLKDEDIVDWHSVDYCIERMNSKRDKPFFLACGLYKPHLAFVAPRKYYEQFPLDEIELPPHRADDLDDIPPAGLKMKNKSDHKKMLTNKSWKIAIQSYLATCAYTDMNVGRLLDALEASPHKDNTIIVLWSDHGWSLGEKQHWRKFALWEEPTRMPFIWVVPGMTPANQISSRTVDLMSIYPTLCELAGIEKPAHVEGQSIVPLLRSPQAAWKHPAITTHGRKNHAVRSERWRFIQYANGDQELYDHRADPYEYKNLAGNPEYASIIKQHQAFLPKSEAPHDKPKGKKKKK